MNIMKEELGNKDTLRLISQAAEVREACLEYLSLYEELTNIKGDFKQPIFLKLNIENPLQEMQKNASIIKSVSQKIADVYLEMQTETRKIAYLHYKKEWFEKQPLTEVMDKAVEEYAKRNIETGNNISFSAWLFENGFENIPLVSHMIIFSAKNIRTEITSEAFSAKRDIEFIFMTSQLWKKSSLLLNTSSNFFFVNLSNPRPPAIIIMSGIRGFFY